MSGSRNCGKPLAAVIDWNLLTHRVVEHRTFYLESFCALPTKPLALTIQQPFSLIGPFADWHLINFGTFTEMKFQLAFTVNVAIWSSVFAIMMGLLGGFLPALRAARIPIVEATKG